MHGQAAHRGPRRFEEIDPGYITRGGPRVEDEKDAQREGRQSAYGQGVNEDGRDSRHLTRKKSEQAPRIAQDQERDGDKEGEGDVDPRHRPRPGTEASGQRAADAAPKEPGGEDETIGQLVPKNWR
jgi:hypothetical protein